MDLNTMTYRSNVGKSKCPSGKVSGAELARRAQFLEAVQFQGNLKYRADLNILHIGDDQPQLSIHCYPDIVRRLRSKSDPVELLLHKLMTRTHSALFYYKDADCITK